MLEDVPTVPAPEPPDSARAWYAPSIHDHYEIVPGVVATVEGDEDGFRYDVREPCLSTDAESELRAVREHFADAERRLEETVCHAVSQAAGENEVWGAIHI